MSKHRHTGQGSAATADPVSSATVKRHSLLPLYFKNKEQNAPRFGIGAGSQLGAHCVRWAGMTDYQRHKKVRGGEVTVFKQTLCLERFSPPPYSHAIAPKAHC